MKRAYIRREVTDVEMVSAVDADALLAVFSEPPKGPTFIRGPRGGIYECVGGWDVKVAGPGADYPDPLSQRWVAVFRSDTRYVRPLSKRWRMVMDGNL
jgi:hypothetical protein